MKILSNKYFLLVCRMILGIVFIFAAITKAYEPDGFAQSMINFLAIILPWIELSAGLLLIFGVSVKENSVILSALLFVFIIAIAISLVRGLDIDCGCFGTVDGTKVGVQKILENVGLLFLGLILIKFDSKHMSLQDRNY
jgi:putative oxidoreductase